MNASAIKYGSYAAILLAAFAAGCKYQGNKLNAVIASLHVKAADAAQFASEQARLKESAMAEAALAAAEADQLRNQEREIVERIVTNEVIKFVQSDAGSKQCLDAAGVRVHNTSAASKVPGSSEPAAAPDATAAGSSAAEVIQVVTANYAACHEWADRLTSLQEWVAKVLSATPAKKIAGPFSDS